MAALAASAAAWREGVAAAALAAGWPVAPAGPQAALLVDAGMTVVLRPAVQVPSATQKCTAVEGGASGFNSIRFTLVRFVLSQMECMTSARLSQQLHYIVCDPASCCSQQRPGLFRLQDGSAAERDAAAFSVVAEEVRLFGVSCLGGKLDASTTLLQVTSRPDAASGWHVPPLAARADGLGRIGQNRREAGS